MTNDERNAYIAELDELLGPPDGTPLNLTPEQSKRVREIQALLADNLGPSI